MARILKTSRFFGSKSMCVIFEFCTPPKKKFTIRLRSRCFTKPAQGRWRTAEPIRKIFRAAFAAAGLPYANPHSLRTTLTRLGERLCRNPEEWKAWSQKSWPRKRNDDFCRIWSCANAPAGGDNAFARKTTIPNLAGGSRHSRARSRRQKCEIPKRRLKSALFGPPQPPTEGPLPSDQKTHASCPWREAASSNATMRNRRDHNAIWTPPNVRESWQRQNRPPFCYKTSVRRAASGAASRRKRRQFLEGCSWFRAQAPRTGQRRAGYIV